MPQPSHGHSQDTFNSTPHTSKYVSYYVLQNTQDFKTKLYKLYTKNRQWYINLQKPKKKKIPNHNQHTLINEYLLNGGQFRP
jgi:hypothetical protein